MKTRHIGDLVSLASSRNAAHAAVKWRDGSVTDYGALNRESERVATGLIQLGLGRGDRIAAWMDDCVEYVILYVAAAKAGLVVSPVNSMFGVSEAGVQIDDLDASAIIYTGRLAESVREVSARTPAQASYIHVGAAAVEGSTDFRDLGRFGGPVSLVPPDEDDLFIIGYTSGTTGRPKGAMLTHRAVMSAARNTCIAYRLPPQSVIAYNATMSFVATVTCLIATHLYVNGTIVFTRDKSIDALADTVLSDRANFCFVPSPLISEFIAKLEAVPELLTHLDGVMHSASKAPAAELRRLAASAAPRYIEIWGMTENAGAVTATSRLDATGNSAALDVFASVGRAVPETLIDVLDGAGVPVPHDGETAGELAIKSPSLMQGYWKLPDATEQALRDGWYRTGDLGAIDAAGYVYVSDRRTDMINSGGMNVYPSEVEAVIARFPGVRECAVVGVPHERWGQTVTAVVVPAEGASLTEQALIDFCQRELARYKKPTRVIFLDDLPRTASDKVKRGTIRDLLTTQRADGQVRA